MSEVKFETAEYSDEYKEPIKDLIYDVYEVETGRYARSKDDRPDLSAIKETYQDNNGNFWVAVKDEKVIGTIGLINQGEQRASMHRFAVAKDSRGKEKGVSAKLYSTLLEFAKNNDYKKIFLTTGPESIAAIRFYEKNGFTKIEFVPEDIVAKSNLSWSGVFYELNLEQKK